MHRLITSFVLLTIATGAGATTAQSSAFTYHGELSRDGQPFDGRVDIGLELFDAENGGNLIGAPVNADQTRVDDGAFAIDVDFGGAFNGEQRWVEIIVDGETLTPRQPVSAAPAVAFALGGPPGPTGTQGPTGAAGPAGLQGNPGVGGVQGTAGPLTPIPTAALNGPAGVFAPNAQAFSFAATTALLATTTPSQKLTGTASVPLATSTGSSLVDFDLCYQQDGGVITPFAGTNVQTAMATTSRRTFATASSVTIPSAGLVLVGFCARNRGTSALDVNDHVNGFVQVTN
jgi:hypothetical protein